jgi:hypothetical protein
MPAPYGRGYTGPKGKFEKNWLRFPFLPEDVPLFENIAEKDSQ